MLCIKNAILAAKSASFVWCLLPTIKRCKFVVGSIILYCVANHHAHYRSIVLSTLHCWIGDINQLQSKFISITQQPHWLEYWNWVNQKQKLSMRLVLILVEVKIICRVAYKDIHIMSDGFRNKQTKTFAWRTEHIVALVIVFEIKSMSKKWCG